VTRLERAVALVARLAGGLGALATAACLLLIGYAVAMRYLAGTPVPWTDKVAGWLVVGLVMLASPEAQRRFEHIGVDVLTARLAPRAARMAHLFGTLSVLATALLLLDAGREMVAFSRMVGLMSDLEGIPIWWVQALLPAGAALLALVAACQSVLLLAGRTPAFLPEPGAPPRDPLASPE
jgi:TRAP-type C4-dicarboxylate transport system permease small subunit